MECVGCWITVSSIRFKYCPKMCLIPWSLLKLNIRLFYFIYPCAAQCYIRMHVIIVTFCFIVGDLHLWGLLSLFNQSHLFNSHLNKIQTFLNCYPLIWFKLSSICVTGNWNGRAPGTSSSCRGRGSSEEILSTCTCLWSADSKQSQHVKDMQQSIRCGYIQIIAASQSIEP